MTDTRDAAITARPALWAYGWWVVVGALFGLGLAAILTIGVVLLAAGAVLALIAVWFPVLWNRSVVATITGLCFPVLYVAWLNRSGPGMVCHADGPTTSCVEQWSPWPFVAAAVVIIVGSWMLARITRTTTERERA